MTRRQRHHSQERSWLQTALDHFVENPCSLSLYQVDALLKELTADIGIFLTPQDYRAVQNNPPTNPEAFATMVATLDGVGTDNTELFVPLLRRVLSAFQRALPHSTKPIDSIAAAHDRPPPVAQRIAAARRTLEVAPAELAALLGISLESYWDLETHDDEAFTCLSLHQLSALADALQVSIQGLVSDDPEPPAIPRLSPNDIAAALRERLVAVDGDVNALGNQLGWDVAGALEHPASIWTDWCLDGLRDVCESLELEWRGLLPDHPILA